jgi:hypothetical protein
MKITGRFLISTLFILLLSDSYAQITYASHAEKMDGFRAAVVRINITPANSRYLRGYNARMSTGVHDSIYHRILVMDDGKTTFVLASTEVCLFSPDEYDQVAERLKTRLGIDPVNFWWTVTHTHSAPELGTPGLGKVFMGNRHQHEVDSEYATSVEIKLIEGIKEAIDKLTPARLGVGWGFSQANINRRAKGTDGKAFLGMNPDGAADRRIGLLRIDHEDGAPLACVANFPVHGTVLGQENLEISGDVPGVVSEYVEQKTGVPLLFINGAAGNLAPIYSAPSCRSGFGLGQFRVLLGDKIMNAYNRISGTTGKVILKTGSLVVETPQKPGLGWPLELEDYSRTTVAGINLVRLPIRFLMINNDIAIWSAPVELFCEISNGIRDSSPFPYTFYYGYTNGWLGYLLTEDEYRYGGYEPGVSPFIPGSAADLTEAVVNYLQGE